uniref:Uncharacterized protein n=1 Tax=Rhizophora mucronata TaxID=61149 RepID=A0A2P2JHR6_RHIMU
MSINSCSIYPSVNGTLPSKIKKVFLQINHYCNFITKHSSGIALFELFLSC